MIKALIKRNGSLHKHLFRYKIEFPFIAIGVSEQDEVFIGLFRKKSVSKVKVLRFWAVRKWYNRSET